MERTPPFSQVLKAAIPYFLGVLSGKSFQSENLIPSVQYLLFETLRDFGWGDFILQKLAPRGVANLELKAILLIALTLLKNNPERSFLWVDQSVALAKEIAPHSAGFVNAVLRNFLRQQDSLKNDVLKNEVAHYKHPQWWIDLVKKDYPDNWRDILKAGNRAPPCGVRVNPLKTKLDDYQKLLFEKNLAFTVENGGILLKNPVPAAELPFFESGFCHIQDLGAQKVLEFLKELKNENALDACAAPGGKAALWLENFPNLNLTALEKDKTRAAELKKYLGKYDLKAQIICTDCLKFETPQLFDSILADCPCSGSGVAGRHPDGKWFKKEKDVLKFAELQMKILKKLWHFLEPQGKIIFASCSVFKMENEYNIAAFLKNEKSAKMIASKTILPTPKNDGFFYALLEKE